MIALLHPLPNPVTSRRGRGVHLKNTPCFTFGSVAVYAIATIWNTDNDRHASKTPPDATLVAGNNS